VHEYAFGQRPLFGMSDRWAGRTVLRRSWLQLEAVELPGPVAHGGHGAEPLWPACTLIGTGTRSRKGSRRARGRRECSRAGRAVAACGAAGRAWLARDDRLVESHALDAIQAASPGGDRAASVRLAMTK